MATGGRTPPRSAVRGIETGQARGEVGVGVGDDSVAASREVGRDVVQAAKTGDHAAFAAIVAHYDERLRVLAFQLLRDRHLMDDALQDAFANAYRALPGFRGEAALGTWLYRICYTTCMGYLRRSSPAMLLSDDVIAEIPDPAADLCEAVARHADLEAALALLPPEQRAVILLVHRDGFSYEDVGEVMGVPSGTVASRLNSARSALCRRLTQWRSVEEAR
jgi:RNA polymerase sigma-70 factor (ECF subfamily)